MIVTVIVAVIVNQDWLIFLTCDFLASWQEYTPAWCGHSNRELIQFGGGITEAECKQRSSNCAAIEYWSGPTKACYKCLYRTKRTPFTNTNDGAYPPHVFIRI